MRRSQRSFDAAICLGFACAGTAASAQTIVHESAGPSASRYPAGRALPADAPLELQANDVITIVKDGRFARTFAGPGTFVARMTDPEGSPPQPSTQAPAHASPQAPRPARPAGPAVVIRAIGPSAKQYPAGTRLQVGTRLTLRAHDSVTVLTNGGTRTFRGPGTFDPTGQPRTGTRASAGPSAGAIRGDDSRGPAGPRERFIICPRDNRCPR